MKKVFLFLAIAIIATTAKAQFSVGADLVSRYVFRGVDFGNSPAVQPTVEFAAGNFSIGAWGSFALSSNTDTEYDDFGNPYVSSSNFNETDLYLSYGFDFGLSLGLTDYYYPGSKWGEFGDKVSSHALELNLGFETGDLSLAANYMLNNSVEGAGAEDGIMYFEAGYAFKNVDVFVGAGDGWHTDDTEFAVVNLGLGTSKEIKFSESFSLPVFGQVIMNPNTEQLHLVVGISL